MPPRTTLSDPARLWKALATALLAIMAISGWMIYRSLGRPVAEVAAVQRGTATAAVYGTVKIQSSVVREIRAQNTGIIKFADGIASGVVSIGSTVKRDQLLGVITDEATTKALRQAQTELEAAQQRQKLGPPSAEPLRAAQDNLKRLLSLQANTVPAAEVERTKAEVKRLTDEEKVQTLELRKAVQLGETNVQALQDQMKRTELRATMDGLLTAIAPADGDLVFANNLLFTLATKDTYVEGQVNEEDVGEIRDGMKADVRLYSFSQRQFTAKVSTVLPSSDVNSQRYTVVLYLENPPDNLRAGMTGEMNIIIARRENALTVPSRALVADQVQVVTDDVVVQRTVKVGYRGLDTAEILGGLAEGDLVVVQDQDQFRPGQRVRPVVVNATGRKR
ncbi:MAG: efflux RND transporter periplasmic adaptor subunit [Verrucomicrobia bacterium]|nr:efflux RND transporter periplasmic adaptor subunit [Verrucomicrobiota bacterium]